jgi:hypothetical protein
MTDSGKQNFSPVTPVAENSLLSTLHLISSPLPSATESEYFSPAWFLFSSSLLHFNTIDEVNIINLLKTVLQCESQRTTKTCIMDQSGECFLWVTLAPKDHPFKWNSYHLAQQCSMFTDPGKVS